METDTKQIVFNSFPRSGSVYSSAVCSAFFNSMLSALHMPEIFSVKAIENVTLFRKPEDAISSLIYKNHPHETLTDTSIENAANKLSAMYRVYMQYAMESSDLIYIGKFDDLLNDPFNHFKNVAKKFNRQIFDDYEVRFEHIKSKLEGNLWEDEYDGHIPREKTEQRKHIDDIVKSLPFIQELNKDYEDFILKYQTKV